MIYCIKMPLIKLHIRIIIHNSKNDQVTLRGFYLILYTRCILLNLFYQLEFCSNYEIWWIIIDDVKHQRNDSVNDSLRTVGWFFSWTPSATNVKRVTVPIGACTAAPKRKELRRVKTLTKLAQYRDNGHFQRILPCYAFS